MTKTVFVLLAILLLCPVLALAQAPAPPPEGGVRTGPPPPGMALVPRAGSTRPPPNPKPWKNDSDSVRSIMKGPVRSWTT